MVERRYDILVFPYLFARKIERKDGLLRIPLVHRDKILFSHPLSACRVTLLRAGAKYPKLPHKNKPENVSFLKKNPELIYGLSGISPARDIIVEEGGITPLPPPSQLQSSSPFSSAYDCTTAAINQRAERDETFCLLSRT